MKHQKPKNLQNNRQKALSRISYEIHSAEHLVRLLFVKNPNTWFTIEDIMCFLREKGKKMRLGSLYNLLCKLKRISLIKSRRSSFAEYNLNELKSENHPIGASSHVQRWSLDFSDYLRTLVWEDVCRIHDIRLWTPVESCDFVDGSWKWSDKQGRYWKRELVDGKYRFTFETYVKARTLSVSVGCSNNAVAVDVEGLTHLFSMLCSVRGCFFNSDSVPHVGEWVVKQWHFGRDTKNSISGFSFEVSFHDWFDNLVRIYTRNRVDGKVRVERVENPNIFVSRLLDGF